MDRTVTPKERLLTTLRCGKADRVPLDLAGIQFASPEDKARIQDPLKREIADRGFDLTHFFFIIPSYVNRILVTPPQRISTSLADLGNGNRRTEGVIDTPKGKLTFVQEWSEHLQTGRQVKYPVESREDLEKIASVPWELPECLEPPIVAEIGKQLADTADRAVICTRLSSPFVCVAALMKFEMFLEMCITDIELLVDLTEICKQRILDCTRVLLSKPGIEYCWLGGSEWVTPPMASPSVYDTLVQEQEREIIGTIHKLSGAVVHLHSHGRIREALPKMIDRGCDYTEPMESAIRLAFMGGSGSFVLRPTEDPSPVLNSREFDNYYTFDRRGEELSPIE